MVDRFKRLPSPAMAVAFLALLAALGGTAVALPGSNSVTGGDIKRSAVKSSDIANNSVRGGDVRRSTLRGSDVGANTLTGSDINEGSLGLVPTANNANNANTANSATSAGSAGSFGGFSANRIGPFTLNSGASQAVGTHGPFTFTARCVDGAGVGEVDAQLEVSTSQNNSALNADITDADFDTGDGALDVVATGNGSTPAFDHADDAYAIAPDGTEVWAEVYVGRIVFGTLDSCRFGGALFVG